ncbi:MAG: type IV pilin [Halodesulfurarchaeum sp.]
MSRAVSPVIGSVMLVLVTVGLVAALALVVHGGSMPTVQPDYTSLSATASSSGEIVLTHRGGKAIDVDEIRVLVLVEGEPLDLQPPVPFFSTEGFQPGPTGPFNVAADQNWTVGERASFVIAGSNAPSLSPGDRVRVEIVSHDRTLAVATASVDGDAT